MANDNVDDIFKDFEQKVKDKKETAGSEISEEELKRKYQKAEDALEEKHRKEKGTLEGKIPSKTLSIERIAYMAVILLFVTYVAVDLSFFHGGKDTEAENNEAVAAAIKTDNKTNESKETAEIVEVPVEEEKNESVENATIEEEKKLSGVVTLAIDDISTKVINENASLGEISKIVFTIDNQKDKALFPVVNVYAYDSEMEEEWEIWSRGQYTYSAGISPGDKHTGSINLVPKTFKNLNLEKDIRLTLNDTKYGFITAVNEKVLIE